MRSLLCCLLLFFFVAANATALGDRCHSGVSHLDCECLNKALVAANHAYEQGRDSGLKDSEYDGLKAYIQQQQCDLQPVIAATSAVKQQVKLYAPMGSLHKVYGPQAVTTFLANRKQQSWIIQPKLDGIAIELIYRDGQLIQAATRGNGLLGQNVLPLFYQLTKHPLTLPDLNTQVIRGELVATKACYKPFASQYMSPRQLAAAVANSQIKPNDRLQRQKIRCLRFYPYDWFNSRVDSELQGLKQLRRWGFEDMARLSLAIAAESVLEQARLLDKLHQLPVDGYVIKLANKKQRNPDLDGLYRPGWALAWKYRSPAVVTKVDSLEWRLGRTGRLTPVVHIKDVVIHGRTISQLSGHSYAWLKQHNIGPGALVSVVLKGEAIAQFDAVLVAGEPPAEIPTALQNGAKPVLCLAATPACKYRFRQQITYSLKQLGATGIGDKGVQLWIEQVQLSSWDQLFNLELAAWHALLGEQSAQVVNTLARIRASDDTAAILTLLGPKGFSKVKITRLVTHFPSFSQLKNAKLQQLTLVPGVGNKLAKQLMTLLSSPHLNF